MKMKFQVLLFTLFISVVIESKPLERASHFEVTNEIDHENIAKNKNGNPDSRKKLFRHVEITDQQIESSMIPKSDDNRILLSEAILPRQNNALLAGETASVVSKQSNNNKTTQESGSAVPQQPTNVPNLLLSLLHRWKFSPQTFFLDLKQNLGNFGFNIPSNNTSTTKQFVPANNLLHLVGLNDSGFYSGRFEPAGFLGGNGWFANKGGLLGGPGAIVSTGSLLTDYPTPYKK